MEIERPIKAPLFVSTRSPPWLNPLNPLNFLNFLNPIDLIDFLSGGSRGQGWISPVHSFGLSSDCRSNAPQLHADS